MKEQSINYQLNPQAKWHLIRIGHEKTPVILVDNFLADLAHMQTIAAQANFIQEQQTYYPGVRAALPDEYVAFVLSQLKPVICKYYAIEQNRPVKSDSCYFSLVAKPSQQLTPEQCIPHFDALNPKQFAIMHYLNSGEYSGTGFFRHKPTGYENIHQQNIQHYQAVQQDQAVAWGRAEKQYINSSTDEYELLGSIAYKSNRLVVYPGTLLHSGLIDETKDLSTDPKSGRLTANIFAAF